MRLSHVLPFLAGSALCAGLFAQSVPTVKKVPLTVTNPSSGEEMYVTYCAACHGKDGRGSGPAAAALKPPPANLTQLAIKNNGNFPEAKILNSLKTGVTAHGSSDMPVWGDILKTIDSADRGVVQMRVYNITNYLRSIQSK